MSAVRSGTGIIEGVKDCSAPTESSATAPGFFVQTEETICIAARPEWKLRASASGIGRRAQDRQLAVVRVAVCRAAMHPGFQVESVSGKGLLD
jgi:hypothetical protein